MNILGKARQLETMIARTFNDAAQRVAPSGPREPLEVLHGVLDAVEAEVQPGGRGGHVFPFNRLEVAVIASSGGARARFEALFDAAPTLRERIVERLRAADCEVTGLTTTVTYVPHADSDWTDPQFHVDFARVAQTPPSEPPSPLPRRIELTVVSGVAEAATYSFAQTRIDLGRCAQVRDVRHRLIRTNQIAFADDGADVNQSVSRSHAHVEYDAAAGHYRLCDDRSAHGTGVLRRGRTFTVAPGSRGVRLQSGDEIVLGEARLRVTFDD